MPSQFPYILQVCESDGFAPHKEIQNRFVTLQDGERYKIYIKNQDNVRCEACVKIDGKYQGTWVLDPMELCYIERPAHMDGMFTFVFAHTHGSSTGLMQCAGKGLSTAPSPNGNVEVTFTPEKQLSPILLHKSYKRAGAICGRSPHTFSELDDITESTSVAEKYKPLTFENMWFPEKFGQPQRHWCEGGTVLTGKSTDVYSRSGNLDLNLDPEARCTLRLKLIGKMPHREDELTALTVCEYPSYSLRKPMTTVNFCF